MRLRQCCSIDTRRRNCIRGGGELGGKRASTSLWLRARGAVAAAEMERVSKVRGERA